MASILHLYQIPDHGVMRIKFVWDAVDPTDSRLCQRLGEPRVTRGGVFTDPNDATFSWQEPDGYTPLLSFGAFGLMNEYDSHRDPYAQRRATVWGAVMKTRLEAALTALRLAGDTFTFDTSTPI